LNLDDENRQYTSHICYPKAILWIKRFFEIFSRKIGLRIIKTTFSSVIRLALSNHAKRVAKKFAQILILPAPYFKTNFHKTVMFYKIIYDINSLR
jgi:pyoverdine/dityrosine biosynthesis protein Dit1